MSIYTLVYSAQTAIEYLGTLQTFNVRQAIKVQDALAVLIPEKLPTSMLLESLL